MNIRQAHRIADKTRYIDGWFSFQASMLFAWIDEIQKANQIEGDIFEIGVHHGKSAVFLGSMLNPQREKLVVCDIFSNQSQNVSVSGSGNRQIFERNINTFFHNPIKLQIFEKLSTTLSDKEIGNNYRFFHIDGGHNQEEALSDLKLAANCLNQKGVIAIDDPFRPEWPGVTEAIIRFLDSNNSFCPVIIGFNKLILARKDYAEIYSKEIDKSDLSKVYGIGYPWHLKQLPFMGNSLRIFYVPNYLMEKPFFFRIMNYYKHCLAQIIFCKKPCKITMVLTFAIGYAMFIS